MTHTAIPFVSEVTAPLREIIGTFCASCERLEKRLATHLHISSILKPKLLAVSKLESEYEEYTSSKISTFG